MLCEKCGKECGDNTLCEECQNSTNDQSPDSGSVELKTKPEQTAIIDATPSNAGQSDLKEKILQHKKALLPTIIGIAVLLVIVVIAVFAVKPNVSSISATYNGETAEGVVLDKGNKGISVTGIDKKGREIRVSGWKIENPERLTADKTSIVKIIFRDVSTNLKVVCSTSETIAISAAYEGSLENGTTVTKEDITVTAKLKNGEETDVSANCVFVPESVDLKTDGTYEIEISYMDPVSSETRTKTLKLTCSTISIEKLSAKYTGKAKAGTILDENNKDIIVEATLKDGSKKELSGWKTDKPIELKEDATATLTITYGEYNCELTVICADMSESKYKAQCQTVPYNSLLRSPGKYKNTYIKITGTVFQIVSEASSPLFYSVYFIKSGGNLYKVDIDNYDSDARILENDKITVWGVYDGIYSYETIRGNSNQIASMTAEYYS